MSKRAVVLSAVLAVAGGLSASPVAHAAFPGQNGQIVFGVAKYDKTAKDYGYVGIGALYTVFPDGSGAVALPNDPGYNDYEPAWSPDGTRLAIASIGPNKSSGIYVGTPTAAEPKLIAKSSTADTPTWTPDGKSVVYFDWRKGILTVPADGSAAPRLLYANPKGWQAIAPAYAADGKTIVFVRQKATNRPSKFRSEIWAMDAAGANVRKVVGHSATLTHPHLPDVSPDSSSIVFEATTAGGKAALFIAGLNGSNPRVLASTNAPAYLSSPAWSPDGTKIVATKLTPSIRKGSSLFVFDAATGAATTLRKAKTSYLLNPSWQPVPLAPTVG